MPKGSRNCRVTVSYTERSKLFYSACNYKECISKIPNLEFKLIFNEGQFITKFYTPYIRKRFLKVNNRCILNNRNAHMNANVGVTRIYLYCSHYGCKTFALHLHNISNLDDDVTVTVYSSSLNYCHKSNQK